MAVRPSVLIHPGQSILSGEAERKRQCILCLTSRVYLISLRTYLQLYLVTQVYNYMLSLPNQFNWYILLMLQPSMASYWCMLCVGLKGSYCKVTKNLRSNIIIIGLT